MKLLAKEELSDIHKDFMFELDKFRKPVKNLPEGDDRVRIIKIIKDARTDNGNGIVNSRNLSKLIKEKFDFDISKTTVVEWSKL